MQALAAGRGSANGLPSRRAAEELRKQVCVEASQIQRERGREGLPVEVTGC